MNGNQENLISLYFHIPFCKQKCHYCHFFVLPDKQELHFQLIQGLKREIALWANEMKGKKLASIYFGGGTPSLLTTAEIEELLTEVHRHIPFDPKTIEITLEANPETISLEKMQAFACAGINRISIGVQTLDDPLLIKLGRTHQSQTSVSLNQNYSRIRYFQYFSIDLMYDIPYQTLSSWKEP